MAPLEYCPVNWKLAGLIPGQNTCLVCRFSPQFLSHIFDIIINLKSNVMNLTWHSNQGSLYNHGFCQQGADFCLGYSTVQLCSVFRVPFLFVCFCLLSWCCLNPSIQFKWPDKKTMVRCPRLNYNRPEGGRKSQREQVQGWTNRRLPTLLSVNWNFGFIFRWLFSWLSKRDNIQALSNPRSLCFLNFPICYPQLMQTVLPYKFLHLSQN